MEISFSTDSDGFLTQECPACSGRFKVVFGEGSDDPISHCPYCAHMDTNCWWTPEQADYISNFTAQQAEMMISDQFKKMARNLNSKSSSIKMSMRNTSSHTPSPTAPEEMELDLPTIKFSCCNEEIKYFENLAEGRLFCVICGTEKSL
tara:strand:+ start:70055 stop:70498 length:444 start_codon:yes stop_codon:yes gene_type:complete